jgi:hypothetical protein
MGSFMEVSISFDAGNSLVRATLHGPFSLFEAQATFLETLAALRRHQAGKVLIDGRTITGAPETVERFYYGEFVASAVADLSSHYLSYVPQFVYVLLPPVLDQNRIGETVAVHRGMHVKAFHDLAAAEDWLGVA